MPTTLASVLVAVIAVFPGLLGDRIYRMLVGVDWREKDWQAVLRLLGFSIVGVSLYSLVASWFGLAPPIHLIPETYAHLDPSGSSLNRILSIYIGHVLGGAVAGALAAGGMKLLRSLGVDSVHPGAWDELIRRCVPGHWIVVSLTNGTAYAGMLKVADSGVATPDRDLILEEPAAFNEATREYCTSSNQYLFIRAADIVSITVVYDPTKDKRLTAVGDSLFPKDTTE